MKKHFLLILLFTVNSTFAQQVIIPFGKYEYKASPFTPSGVNTAKVDTSLYSLYRWPSVLSKVLLLRYHAHEIQWIYEQYNKGAITQSRYRTLMNMGLYDSAGISPSFIQEYIDILAGVTEKGDTISIIDTNRDMNFGNDTIYYKSSPFLPHTGFIKVDGTEFYYKGQKVKDAIYIKPWFQNAYIQDENGPGLHVGVVISNYKKSTFITCGKRYQFALAADNQAFVFKPYFTKILFAEYPKPFPTEADKNLKPNSIGDTIRLGKAYYRLDSITPFGDALYIRPLKKTSQPIYGFNTGYTARPFQATDFITGQSLSSQSINAQNKYLLIDFWGTWCHPCIKALPDLQQLYQHCKGKNIEMLSVACENTIDTTKLRTAIQEYGIVWHNIAEDKLYKNNPTHQLQRDFRINAYPTILLIAPNGKIIARETGTGGTKKMAEKIKRLLQ